MEFSSPWFLALLFMGGSYVFAFMTRRVVETAAPSLRPTKLSAALAVENTPLENVSVSGAVEVFSTGVARWWNQVILYAIAPAWGGLFAVMGREVEQYPPELRVWWLALMFGSLMGFLSSFGFKLLKKVFMDRVGVVNESDMPSMSPPAPPGS